MIVALGFCQKDAAAARDMLLWCEQLGGCREFDALLVADPETQWSETISVMDQCSNVFRATDFVSMARSLHGWPEAANAMFTCAAAHIADHSKGPFLWMEPDAVPLKPGWLKAIHEAYRQEPQRPFMGRLYSPSKGDDPKLPKRLMSGIAVYPEDTARLFVKHMRDDVPWDVATANFVVPLARDTNLIQWFWGQPKLPPTFALAPIPNGPINLLTLDRLEPQAVLFHRNKDGTLMQCLRERAGIQRADDFIVVFSFTRQDVTALAKLMDWIAELGTPKTHDALLWYENGVDQNWVARVSHSAQRSFKSVFQGTYRDPQLGPNGAWMSAARQMHTMRRPWFWMEPDAVPTTEGWLRTLQARYRQQHKPFMGPVVRDMGHMNGTGIYPWNTPNIVPRTMSQTARGGWAWDMVMKDEMIHLCHDCSDLYQHAWIEENGTLQPHGHGTHPTFPNRQSLSRLTPSAVVFHRNKDLTLIDRLREKRSAR